MASKGLTLAIAAVFATAIASAAATTVAIYHFTPPAQTAVTETPDTSQGDFGQRVHDYLVANPEVMLEVQTALQQKQMADEQAAAKAALVANKDKLLEPDHDAVFGNKDGAINVIEFFDYNCGYCRRAVPDMDGIIAKNDDVRFVLKEIPVLGPDSEAAQRVSYAMLRVAPDKYSDFHHALMESGTKANEETAIAVAASLGVDEATIRQAMTDYPAKDALDPHFALARAIGVTGTPAYIIGDTLIQGAVGADTLQKAIDNVRSCGDANCS
ncbi:DsbA family protein [Martelella sp. HB161492]|uniref:DsbA family protein n=1 Tax=Martelella sp. HB161492 TaxID=2720726 RepID=UPI0015926018|nr:DsbA family protein [Martelella sp. HB161492]